MGYNYNNEIETAPMADADVYESFYNSYGNNNWYNELVSFVCDIINSASYIIMK